MLDIRTNYTHIQFQQWIHKFFYRKFVTDRNKIALSLLVFVLVMSHFQAKYRSNPKKSGCCYAMHSTYTCSLYLYRYLVLSFSRAITIFSNFSKRFIFMVHCFVVIAKWKWLPFFIRYHLLLFAIATTASILIYGPNVVFHKKRINYDLFLFTILRESIGKKATALPSMNGWKSISKFTRSNKSRVWSLYKPVDKKNTAVSSFTLVTWTHVI